jgi:hypothetical protein
VVSPASSNHHKVLVVGGGSAGLSVANMLYNRFADAGKRLGDGDIAILDVSLAFCARHVPCFVVLASLEGEVRKKPSSRLVRTTDNRYQKREELFKEPSSWSSAWEGGALGSLGSGSQLPLLSRVLTLRLGVLLSDFLCSSSESMEQTRWRSIGTSSRWSWEEAGREAYKWRRQESGRCRMRRKIGK